MGVKKKTYPSKQTLNLVIRDLPPHYYRRIIIGLLAGIAVISVFTKFAVIDRMSTAYAAEREAADLRMRHQRLTDSNADFADVKAEYEKYFKTLNTEDVYVDCMDAIWIIESTLMSNAGVQSAALTNNVLSVVLTGITLEQAAAIVRELYANDLVGSASISSADTTVEDTYSAVTMTITLEGADTK